MTFIHMTKLNYIEYFYDFDIFLAIFSLNVKKVSEKLRVSSIIDNEKQVGENSCF